MRIQVTLGVVIGSGILEYALRAWQMSPWDEIEARSGVSSPLLKANVLWVLQFLLW
jgi:energy-converting hydrogenase Eha subunit G